MNVATLLHNAARSEGSRPAVATGTRTHLTYRELSERVGRLAAGLRERYGLAAGDRIALVMPNRAEYLESLFACWHGGFIAVPINAKLHAREMAYIVGHAGADVCFVEPSYHDEVAAALAEAGSACALQRVGDTGYADLCASQPQAAAEVETASTAWLFYTSGTTGRPKGAMLTHRTLIAMTLNYFCDMDGIEPGDAIVQAAPLSHGAGLWALPHVAKAAVNVIPQSGGFDAAEIFELIGAYRNVSMFAAPTMVVRLCAYAGEHHPDTANLKSITYGGGPMYVSDTLRALELFGPKLVQLYGQGESPMTIAGLSKVRHGDRTHPRYLERLGSVGVARVGCEVRVVDERDEPVPTGETGEVIARGDTVMAGYWNDPQASATALRGGWLHTGDLGAFDEDGYLTLKDRAKDMIISGGTNIYSRELEEILLTHPAVREVAVVGRANAEWGEEVVAFIVCERDTACDAAALEALCLARLARFKRPRAYYFVPGLPKNNYGKVLKTALRERLAADAARAAGPRA